MALGTVTPYWQNPVANALARSQLRINPPATNQINPLQLALAIQGQRGSPSGPTSWAPPVLNQANPNLTADIPGAAGGPSGAAAVTPALANTTYVSPNTPQPSGSVPVTGQAGTPSGAAPDLAKQARNYRVQHGLGDDADTDALNAESLAAAKAGRTNLNRTLAAQYGATPAANVYGPRTDVVNALQQQGQAT